MKKIYKFYFSLYKKIGFTNLNLFNTNNLPLLSMKNSLNHLLAKAEEGAYKGRVVKRFFEGIWY
ncbi:hypothetical protein BpHYR1_023372 [Brachionus plicatilis]|uniref:Uncharacterized protein n=1 Tax=Brachionus plicatilis TaxID=10195 RepID=A0A3M7QC72_BRAPC|nr:hypothetical protein BpHYR1_023372 [Brachionus plicatilis]